MSRRLASLRNPRRPCRRSIQTSTNNAHPRLRAPPPPSRTDRPSRRPRPPSTPSSTATMSTPSTWPQEWQWYITLTFPRQRIRSLLFVGSLLQLAKPFSQLFGAHQDASTVPQASGSLPDQQLLAVKTEKLAVLAPVRAYSSSGVLGGMVADSDQRGLP